MRLVILLALFTPCSAFADPVSVGAFLASNAFTIGTFAVSWGSVLFTAGSWLYGQSQQKKQDRTSFDAKASSKDSFQSSLSDRTISGVAVEKPYRYIYGEARVGANIVAMFSSGDAGAIKHIVCVICQHEIESIDEVYLNQKAVGALDVNGYATVAPFGKNITVIEQGTNIGSNTIVLNNGARSDLKLYYVTYKKNLVGFNTFALDEGGWGVYVEDVTNPIHTDIPYTRNGNVITYSSDFNDVEVNYSYTRTVFSPFVRVKKHLGAIGDPADSDLISEVPSLWNANCTLTGHAYVYLRIDQEYSEFQQGLPQIEFLVKGKKLYDPRTTLTTYSANPALVARDYLTSELCNVKNEDVPESQFIAAANDCDDYISNVNGPRYTFNGTIDSDQNQGDVLEKIAQSMAGGIVATSWDIYAGKFSAPVMSLNQSDIVGAIAVSPGFPRSDIYNTVKGQFISAENSYQSNDFVPYKNDAYINADGESLETNIDLPYTNTQQRVTNLCRIFVEDNRNAFSISGKFSMKAWSLKVGDRVVFTSEFFGSMGKIFRVTDKAISPDSSVDLGLKEDSLSIYDQADEQLPDATPNSNFPDPFDIQPLEYIDCESGTNQLVSSSDGSLTSRILVTWPQAITPAVVQNGEIEIQYLEADDASGNWSSLKVSGAQTSAFISGVKDQKYYFVRARTLNPYLSLKSDWVTTIHYVIGKSEPPPDVEGFLIDGKKLTWISVPTVDLAGYIIRFNYGSNYDWNFGTTLPAGLITSSSYDLTGGPSGQITLMIKAVDTSGNFSNQAAVIFTNLGDPDVANVVQTIDFHPTFNGTITGGSVSGGNLLATANDSFYGDDSTSFYTLEAESFYEVGTYQKLIYETNDVLITGALVGSNMTLDIDTQGAGVFIEYRINGGGSFYGLDGDSLYGINNTDSFYDGNGIYKPWPGSLVATNDLYQFRVTIAAGEIQGRINSMSLIIDAPDLEEVISDLTISSSGTIPTYSTNFSNISNIQATLQTNGSGAVRVEIDKTVNLSPVIKCFNSSNVAVSGAKVDLILKGY